MTTDAPKLALIVGGSSGIGRAAVPVLRKRGYGVIATHHTATDQPDEDDVGWVHFDAERPATAEAVRQAVLADGRALAAMLYLVGVPSSKRAVGVTPLSEFQQLYTVNALGLVTIWQAVGTMARQARARVGIVSSEATQTVSAQNGPYTASKAALEVIAVTLAKEEADAGVRVNVVAPSLVDTPQARRLLAHKGVTDIPGYRVGLPWRRPLAAREVAELAVSLVDDEHWVYATGQVIRLAASGVSS